MNKDHNITRRNFISKSTFSVAAVGMLTLPQSNCYSQPRISQNDNINFVGPKSGFTPQVGTLVSMMNWMRNVILSPVRGLNIKQLDYIHDENANSIGAMLMHLAATERFYQEDTFNGKKFGEGPEYKGLVWDVASGLGEEARESIKGNSLEYYLGILGDVRSFTLEELAQRDDDWLLSIDQGWGWGPTNNYCKWFHVVEHESNHNGQIKWIKSRIEV